MAAALVIKRNNKMKRILSITFLSIVFFIYGKNNSEISSKETIYQSTTDLINEIDSLVSSFKNNKFGFTRKTYPASEEQSSKDQEIILYTRGDLQVLCVTSYGSLGKSLRDSYYNDGKLIKIEETIWSYNMPITEPNSEIASEENFEYYYNGSSNLACKSNGVIQSSFPNDYKLNSSLISELNSLMSSVKNY